MPLYGHEMNEEITPKMAGLPCKLTGKDFTVATRSSRSVRRS